MKKSVRIRKAGPGETPGYYNKTAKFLDKALPKAKVGMQVGNGLQDKLQVIMLDTYSSVRDGNDPQEVFRKLLMEYGMPQEMAYKIMQTVMQKLAQDGYADPASLQEDEEDQVAQAPQEQSEPSAPMMQNQNPGTPDEDEQLALSEAEGDTGYDAMDYYNDRSMEEQEQQELSKYGGPLRRKLKRAQQGMQQPSEEEIMMMQQGQGQPEQQQGGGDQMQQIMQQVGQALEQGAKPEDIIAQLLQGQIPPEAIMQIFVQFGMGEEQVGQVIQSVMQQLQGGQEQMMMYGGSYDDGGEYDNYFDEEQTPQDTVIEQYSNPGQLSMEQKAPMSVEAMLQSFNLPSSDMQTPDLNAYLQSVYNYRNVGSDDIPNDLLPTAKHGGSHINLPLAARGKGVKAKEKTPPPPPPKPEVKVEPTIRIEPQVTQGAQPNWFQNLQNAYYTKNALAPKRGVMGTAAQVLGTGINYIRPENWAESSKAFGLIGGREGVEPATTATKTYEDIYKILRDKEYKPETLQKNEDGTYSSGLAFNMGPQLYEMLSKDVLLNHSVQTGLKNHGSVQLEFPTSKVPELNFLSLHNEKSNTKIKLVKDSDGALKIQLITDVKTPLKGVDKNKLTIKDEFFFDPATESLIDTKTGMPLEMIQKSYYKGNELNWYNQSGTFPFTKKYKSGLDISKYPEVVSSEPLKQTPGSRWNAAWNMIGKPALFTPYVLPFTYPGFAARNKFYPESNKVTVDYFGRQRELGPQAPGGMTFGDQPFGTQYADYNLQANRNYLTGRNFMIGAGLLGAGLGAGYLYYNRDTKDWEIGAEDQPNGLPQIKQPGNGFSFDNKFGRSRPTVDYKENNYGLDSMYINNGDTIHDKGWGELAPGYKDGGAHKKKFLKRMQQMFEPGGEAQDTSLGKGSRLDNLDRDVAKKKEWVPFLKKQSDKAANEELYNLVQKSGDPQLMNIFMGDDQSNQGMQQPMSNNQMAEGGEPCPPGTHWDELIQDCVEDETTPVNPTRQQILNDPEYREYLDKLEYRRDVNDYKDWRGDEFHKNTPKKIVKPGDEDYPSNGTGEPMEMLDRESQDPQYLEWKNQFKQEHPSPQNPGWQMPYNAIPNQEHYPQIGPWNEEDQYYYDEFFNPDTKGDSENYDEQGNKKGEGKVIQKDSELKKQMQKRYDEWCPCSKRKPIYVQGKQVMQEVCVPCEEAEEGGFVNMDMNNPLTRFIYGGYDEAPDYYESNMLPEASDGIEITNRAGQNRMVADVMPFEEWAEGEKDDFATTHPGIDFETWKAGDESGDDYQDYASFHHKSLNEYQDFGAPVSMPSLNFNSTNTSNTNTQTKCGPGTVWIEAYGQCVPIMKTKYNARMVSGDPGLHNIFLPWNPIFKTRGYKTKYGDRLTLKDLQKYAGKELGNPYATLTYRKNMLSPKRQLDIWNPDGKLSEADMKALMDYGVGKGWNKKGSKNKSNSSANKEEKTKRENKKEGPREVKFSSAAAKYRLQQGFDKAFGAPIDYYKNLGKKIIKPFTKKK